MRPVVLDLCCGAGGAAEGYHRAGYDVIGVDIADQPRYPFKFRRMDWRDAITDGLWKGAALVHASPPCQAYSDLAHRNGNGDSWPKYIELMREMLDATNRDWVIENVEGAPLFNPLMLCGTMFNGLRVLRHRLFEFSYSIVESDRMPVAPPHGKHPLVYTRDKRKRQYGQLSERESFVMVNGGGNCSAATARDAMGIDWMTKAELNEAIPPAYTEFIGERLLKLK